MLDLIWERSFFLILLSLLGLHWLLKLSKIKVYNFMICHLYIVLRVHMISSHVSFHHHLSCPSFSLFRLPPPHCFLATTILLCIYGEILLFCVLLCLLPSPFLPSPAPLPPLTTTSLFLFCLLVLEFIFLLPNSK